MAEDERKGDRIAKLLARAGVASRREVERMIADKRIAIDGKTVETPATLLESLRGVTVDGKPVAKPEPTRLFAFHKPTGLITAEHDPRGRPTIYDALRNSLPKDAPRVMPIGRLDFNTEGLLLLTNDGGITGFVMCDRRQNQRIPKRCRCCGSQMGSDGLKCVSLSCVKLNKVPLYLLGGPGFGSFG